MWARSERCHEATSIHCFDAMLSLWLHSVGKVGIYGFCCHIPSSHLTPHPNTHSSCYLSVLIKHRYLACYPSTFASASNEYRRNALIIATLVRSANSRSTHTHLTHTHTNTQTADIRKQTHTTHTTLRNKGAPNKNLMFAGRSAFAAWCRAVHPAPSRALRTASRRLCFCAEIG